MFGYHYVLIDVNITIILKTKTFVGLGPGDWSCINDIYL